MAMWLIRATKQAVERASPATMAQRFGVSFVDAAGKPISNAVAIYQPDLSAVAGFATKYWKLTGDLVALMSPAERSAVDLAELQARRDQVAAELDNLEDKATAIVLLINDAINQTNARINALKAAFDNGGTYAAARIAVGSVQNLPQRTAAEIKQALRNKLGSA